MECRHPLAVVSAAKADSRPPRSVDLRTLWMRGARMLALRLKLLAVFRTDTK